MKKLSYALTAITLAISLNAAHATTVIPPTFTQLVGDAELIFQGTVTGSSSMWVGEGAERHIITDVMFKVKDVVKGKAGATYSIRMLGGTVDGETMEISDAPKFNAGERAILFVEHNGEQFVPLVGIMHGRFQVLRDQSGDDLVLTNSGSPVTSMQQFGPSAARAEGAPMTVEQFKGAIHNEVTRLKKGLDHPNQ